MKDFILPDAWKKKAEEIISKNGISIVLGEVDTGKTTLVTYLARMAVDSGKVVGIVDADVGQSDIGPPATIGLGIVNSPFENLSSIKPSALYFVGSISPEGHLLPMVVGTQRMVKKAQEQGAEIIIVDTTGLVYGGVGRALKFYKIHSILPQNIIGLERRGEIEHLLKPFEGLEGITIHRLPVPDGIKKKDQQIRQANRKENFQNFFKDTHTLEIPFSEIRTTSTLFLSGKALSENELERLSMRLDEPVLYGERIPEGLYLILPDILSKKDLIGERTEIFQFVPEDFSKLLVGLCKADGEVLSLGIIEKIDFLKRVIKIKTPIPDKKAIKIIQFSKFKLDL